MRSSPARTSFLLVLVAAAALAAGCGDSATVTQPPAATALGRFGLTAVNSPDSMYTTQWQGKVLCLVFISPYCPHCKLAAPSLQDSIWSVYQSRGVQLVAVAVTVGYPDSDLVGYADSAHVSFPVCRCNASLRERIGVPYIPFVALVDRQGLLVYQDTATASLISDADVSALRRRLDSMLAGTAAGSAPPAAPGRGLPVCPFP